MSDDTKRDAAADLAVCAAATPGPWDAISGYYPRYVGPNERWPTLWAYGDAAVTLANVTFASVARTALPHWIERATAAEAEVERLRASLAVETVCPYCGETCLFAGKEEVYCESCGERWKWAKGGAV